MTEMKEIKVRTIQVTKEQWEILEGIMDRKRAYHEAIRKYGPGSEEG